MPKYVLLTNWTDQGVKNFRDTVKRGDTVSAQAKKVGGKMTQLLWTVGPYDVVGILEFPDDETASAFSLWVASLGNVRTTTMRAFDAAEMTKVIAKTS